MAEKANKIRNESKSDAVKTFYALFIHFGRSSSVLGALGGSRLTIGGLLEFKRFGLQGGPSSPAPSSYWRGWRPPGAEKDK